MDAWVAQSVESNSSFRSGHDLRVEHLANCATQGHLYSYLNQI